MTNETLWFDGRKIMAIRCDECDRLKSQLATARNDALDEAAQVANQIMRNYHGIEEEIPIDSYTCCKIESEILSLKTSEGEGS